MAHEDVIDAVIIGGGFAGVAAMRDLRAEGRSVVLLEARDRLGGRTWYRKFADTDQLVEIGGTWSVDRRQPRIAEEKARYSLGTIQSPMPQNWTMRLDGTVRDGWLPVPYDDIAGMERAVYFLIRDSMRIEFGTPFDQQGLDDLDVSVTEWMKSRDLDKPAQAFISAFVGLNLGCSPDDASALHFLTWIAGMGNSPWTMSTVLTEKFEKGTKSLIDAMVAESDADIWLSSPVARVEQDDQGVIVTTRSGDTVRARTAIVATPLNTWHDLEFSPALSAPKVSAAAAGHSGHAVKPWVMVKGAPEYFGSWAWDSGMCYLATEFEREDGAVMVGFAHAPDVVDINDPADVASKARAILPDGAEVIAVDGHDWNGDEFSQGTWMAFAPGQLAMWHSGLMANEGRVVFAGSDIAPRWAGWMEGALESGRLAARSVEELLSGLKTAGHEFTM
jgi:monoamine oxidase